METKQLYASRRTSSSLLFLPFLVVYYLYCFCVSSSRSLCDKAADTAPLTGPRQLSAESILTTSCAVRRSGHVIAGASRKVACSSPPSRLAALRAPIARSPPWCVLLATAAIRRHVGSGAGRDGGRRDTGRETAPDGADTARGCWRGWKWGMATCPAMEMDAVGGSSVPSRQLIRPSAEPWLRLGGREWTGAPYDGRRGCPGRDVPSVVAVSALDLCACGMRHRHGAARKRPHREHRRSMRDLDRACARRLHSRRL